MGYISCAVLPSLGPHSHRGGDPDCDPGHSCNQQCIKPTEDQAFRWTAAQASVPGLWREGRTCTACPHTAPAVRPARAKLRLPGAAKAQNRTRHPPARPRPLTQVLPTQHRIRPAPLRRLHGARGLRLSQQEAAQSEAKPPPTWTQHLPYPAVESYPLPPEAPPLLPLTHRLPSHRARGVARVTVRPGQSSALTKLPPGSTFLQDQRFRPGQFSGGSPFRRGNVHLGPSSALTKVSLSLSSRRASFQRGFLGPFWTYWRYFTNPCIFLLNLHHRPEK